jgi:phospholipid N-methyltransferase
MFDSFPSKVSDNQTAREFSFHNDYRTVRLYRLRRHPLLVFFRVMLRHPVSVCAVAPSSQELARAMTHGIHLRPKESLIELGPGTGALTAQIHRILPASDAYLGIELEARFVQLLKERFPDLRFVQDTVARAHRVHVQSGLEPVKAIISGLSIATLPEDVQEAFIHNIDRLMTPGCLFRMFQYVHAYPWPSSIRFRQRMSRLFNSYHRSRVVFKNIPPAFVLTWRR